ncbi:MAG TPA: hypothetical protein PKH69_12755 [Thiobacillaceae bacterium]|nr:hypothetical protein [Thiobacillaceae bacterium]HNU65383.1 hypothetical protein [Thiobacillaceae bacterium]
MSASGTEGHAPSLTEAADRALATQGERVAIFTWNGEDYVAKRVTPKARGVLKRTLLSLSGRLLFPGHVLRGGTRPGDGRFEAGRIRSLQAAGVRVPRVVQESPHAVVYSHCGTTLSLYLARQPAAVRASVIVQALDDLAAFHRAGHWHGGAQFRNLLVSMNPEGRLDTASGFCRIDFEEDLGGQFSLPLLQMYDLCLFLMDALTHAPNPDQATHFGLGLLQRYRQVCWSPTHGRLLRRLARMLYPARMLEPLLARKAHNEIRRTLALARLLDLARADTQ